MVAEPVNSKTKDDKRTIYTVKDKHIKVKDKWYSVRLDDGEYYIRKLTVDEEKSLQTIPDWYEFPVSDLRAYAMIGNGWTVDVISHILSFMFN